MFQEKILYFMKRCRNINGINGILSNSVSVYLFFLFICCAFCVINYLTPMRCDDLIYQFQWESERVDGKIEPIDLNHRVSDFSDAFYSQVNHYKVMNGRFLIHFIVQCFCGFLGKPMFNVVNTIIYVFFLFLCIRFISVKTQLQTILALSLLWLLLPIQHIFYYSISFAVNYLWTSLALILFLLVFRFQIGASNENKSSALKKSCILIFCIFVGALHEGYSLPLSCALFVYVIVYRKKLNIFTLFMICGIWIGTVIHILSPGTLQRGAGSLSGESIHSVLIMKMDVLRYSKRLYIFILLCLISFFYSRKFFDSFIKRKQLEMFFIIMDFGFVLAVPHYTQRIEFPLELLSVLLSIEMILGLLDSNKKLFYICVPLAIVTIIHISLATYYNQLVNNEYHEMLQEYKISPMGQTHYRDLNIPKIINPYIKRMDNNVERNYISFVYGKEMIIDY